MRPEKVVVEDEFVTEYHGPPYPPAEERYVAGVYETVLHRPSDYVGILFEYTVDDFVQEILFFDRKVHSITVSSGN